MNTILGSYDHQVVQDGDDYVIRTVAIGYDKKDVRVSLDGRLLSVSGTRKEEDSLYSTLNHRFKLPFLATDARAVLKNGILEIRVQKDKTNSKEIKVE